MLRYLLLSASDDRRKLLEACLRSVSKQLSEWRLVFVAQGFPDAYLRNLGSSAVIAFDKRIGPHSAKIAGLSYIDRDAAGERYVVCSIDDDMEFTEETDFEGPMGICFEPGVGLVSTGWVDHESKFEKRKQSMRMEYIKQPIVYTGGGLLFSDRIASLILAMPDRPYLCDNTAWSLATYVEGYENYRYRGSLSIHRINSKGGRRPWLEEAERVIADPAYIETERAGRGYAGKNAYKMPKAGGLTEKAKRLHAINRERLLS